MTNKTKHNYEQLPGFTVGTNLYVVDFKCRNYTFYRSVNYKENINKFSCLRDLAKLKKETIEIINKQLAGETYGIL